MTGKPSKLIVSWRCTSAITRLLRARSNRCSTRSRLASSSFWRRMGWIAEIMKNSHRMSPMLIGTSLTARAPAGSRALTVADQPVGDTQGRRHRGQGDEGQGGVLLRLEDDELPRDGENRDQEHRPDLDDVVPMRRDPGDRVLEFERDEQNHDLAEDALEHRMLERSQTAVPHQREHFLGEVPRGDEDDDRDERAEHQGDELLEALVEAERTPRLGELPVAVAET